MAFCRYGMNCRHYVVAGFNPRSLSEHCVHKRRRTRAEARDYIADPEYRPNSCENRVNAGGFSAGAVYDRSFLILGKRAFIERFYKSLDLSFPAACQFVQVVARLSYD